MLPLSNDIQRLRRITVKQNTSMSPLRRCFRMSAWDKNPAERKRGK